MTLGEELDAVVTKRLKNAFRTGELISAADWVSEIASCLAMAVVMVDESDVTKLSAFAHAELTRYITEHSEERQLLHDIEESEDEEDDAE